MGIRGLNTMIKKFSPDAITYNDISKYRNAIVAIDCSILLYKFKYASKAENSHLVGIANRIKFYMMNGILPVFVFDGIPPAAKRNTINKRHDMKEKLYVKLDELKEKIPENDEDSKKISEEIERISSQIIVIKKYHIEQCKEFLEKSGIPYCTAPSDAEKYCAFLQKNELVNYTVTDDTDAVTFGCQKILKTSINRNIIEIDSSKILLDFDMEFDSFVDYCILSGCDYTDTINQIGPVTSYNLIKKHKTIENVLKTIEKIKPIDNFNYQEARKIFTEFDYEIPEKFYKKNINKQILLQFLNLHDFKENVISKFIKILI
jgi:flap endonuclease-1